jgi:outer membrane scaffolding protein for murein synthesis (MipA/OmpV family)
MSFRPRPARRERQSLAQRACHSRANSDVATLHGNNKARASLPPESRNKDQSCQKANSREKANSRQKDRTFVKTRFAFRPLAPAVLCAAFWAAPALASETENDALATGAELEAEPVAVSVQSAPAAPPPMAFTKPVFDETWATIGLGVGLVPSYAGSNDYIAFPLPLIVGRVGGVGIRPNGPGLALDLFSPAPTFGKRKVRASFGPAFRIRNDRQVQIKDDVVERAGELDMALEVGLNGAVAFPGVFKPLDTLSVGVQVRRDVLNAHDGLIVEPQINYSTPLGRAFLLQVQTQMEFVDDSFADYYFSVTPAQRASTGLPAFTASGGLNRVGTLAILSYDLDKNALNGGLSLTGIGGYSRLLGDAADTPFTALRGDPNQFILGLGVAYTF